MARSDQQKRDDEGRFSRRNRVVETVRDRPYSSAGLAALATVAAGAAAFFLTRKSDKPVMNWGQAEGDNVKGAGAYKGQGSTTGSSSSLETASSSPSSSAGVGAGTGGSSPSAIQASSMETKGTSGIDLGKPGSDALGSAEGKGSTGLDQTAKDQTKTGSVAYGA